MTSTSTALCRVGEFGPFDLLTDWAHGLYIEGRHEEAVRSAREALAMVSLTDDQISPLYLQYIIGTSLHELGQSVEATLNAQLLLARIDPDRQPYWRAKGLSLLAEAYIREGEMDRAMDALAEASALLHRFPSTAYNHMSASMAVALAMRAMYVYREADALLVASIGTTSAPMDLLVLDEACQSLLYWAASCELVGRHDEARGLYVRALSRALATRRAARALDEPFLVLRSEIIEAFVLERLGHGEAAAATLTRLLAEHDVRDEVIDGHLARITLARVLATRGRTAEAQAHLKAAIRYAERAARDVWAATAVLVQVEVDRIEHGDHPGLVRSTRVAQESILRLWRDRESRFADIQARSRVAELLQQTERMGQEVLEDPLTGLGNRRLLVDAIAGRTDVISAIFVDLDRFKDTNDTYGHAVGDRVLLEVADLLRSSTRSQDVVIRYGGDEFIVLVDSDPVAAHAVADRVHQAVQQHDWEQHHPGLRVTVSVGVATSQRADAVLAAADKALYSAKRQGRDQVVLL